MYKILEILEKDYINDQEQEEVIEFLKKFECLKGNFDVLTKIQLKKVFDYLQCAFFEKGQYLFKKNDIGENAFIILYGTIAFYDVITESFLSKNYQQRQS